MKHVNVFEKAWVEKYRPKLIDDLITPESTKTKIKALLKNDSIPNMLFYSPTPGTGKTSTALAICNTLGMQTLMINGSNEGRLVDTLRNKIIPFASSMSIDAKKKCVIIDEADYMPEEMIQPALRNLIEEFNKAGVVFIFTCNNVSRIIEPLRSRCALIDFTIKKDDAKTMKMDLCKRLIEILKQESVKIENPEILPKMIQMYFPDCRRLINELQLATTDGVLDSSALTPAMAASEIVELVELVKQKKVKSVREWIAQNPHCSIETINKYLYDSMYDIVKQQSMADLILIVANWNYKSSFMSDKEIAIAACLTDLMMTCEFQP